MAGNRRHYRRGRRSKRRGFASWSIGKKIGLILGGTVAFVAAAGVGILASKLSKIDHVSLKYSKGIAAPPLCRPQIC